MFPFASCGLLLAFAGLFPSVTVADDDPFADHVVAYDPGSNPAPGYTDSAAALGPPQRFTGEGWDPMIVSAMNAAWRPDEIVSIGMGGQLVLQFDTPVTDDPLNPWGSDLLVFGNAFLQDRENGELDHYCTDPALVFNEGGVIEVSPDGENWTAAPGVEADGLFPTEGYLDKTDPYDAAPGAVESRFTRPVNPAITLSAFDGLSYTQVLDLYAGSGGGAGIDIGALRLAQISYVRITNPENPELNSPEIDAVADVSPRLPGDANIDGRVDIDDLVTVINLWGPSRPHGWDADFDSDGLVGIDDLVTVINHWST